MFHYVTRSPWSGFLRRKYAGRMTLLR